MQTLLSIQHWLYGGMADGLGAVVGGRPVRHPPRLCAAILFGAVHALMPGHGKTVLVSYHLGQPARPIEGFVNGSILAVTHVGLAVVLVLAGFAVISRAFAYGGRTPQFEAASGILIVLIGAFLLWRSLADRHERTSNRRQDAGLGDRHDPLPPDDLRLELCAGARRAGGRLGGDGSHDGRDDRHASAG